MPWPFYSPSIPNVRAVLEPCIKHQERMRDALAAGWAQGDGQHRRKSLYGALWMGLEFQTWHTLARQQGFADAEMVEMMVGTVSCLMRD
jgi:hypothetical protein